MIDTRYDKSSMSSYKNQMPLGVSNNGVFGSMSFGNIFDSMPSYTDPFASQFGGSSFGSYFGSMDFIAIMMQQRQLLATLFAQQPMNFSIGLPSQKNIGGGGVSSAEMKKRVASMKLSPESSKNIEEMSKRLKIDSDDLKALIYAESSGNPQAVNSKSGATGLIQFMPKTARAFGTTTSEIGKMSAEEQLKEGGVIEQYLTKTRKQAGFDNDHKLTSGELYALVFMPAKAKQEVMCKIGSKAYLGNSGLDINGNGEITKKELGRRISGRT